MSKAWLLAGALAMMAPGVALAQGNKAAIAAALADKDRPEADVSRDAGRKPGELLAFAGVKPGMKVGELLPGGGYFTRLLSRRWGRRASSISGCLPGRRPNVWRDSIPF
jgi:predicted methyltransferase